MTTETKEGRGISSVSGSNGNTKNKKITSVVAIGVIAVIVGFLVVSGGDKDEKEREQKLSVGAKRNLEIGAPPPPPPLAVEKEEVLQVIEAEPEIDKMFEASIRAPILAVSTGSRPAQPPAQTSNAPNSDPFTGGASDNPLQAKLNPVYVPAVSATAIQNLHMVIPQGTLIPCILETALSSDVPGFVTCSIQRDVMSASGHVILLEKGSQVVGEYQGGIERGQARIFVLWSNARSPMGVKVNLASPSADAVGRSGFDGRIDTKFWERFGSAMFLSIVMDASNYGFSRLSENSGSSSDTSNSQNATQNAAAIAVENSINIKPTLYKNQGEIVSIMVARDLDFSGVYRLRRQEKLTEIYDRTVTGDMSPRDRRIRK